MAVEKNNIKKFAKDIEIMGVCHSKWITMNIIGFLERQRKKAEWKAKKKRRTNMNSFFFFFLRRERKKTLEALFLK